MLLQNECFSIVGSHRTNGYFDIDLCDTGANGHLRQWRITKCDDGRWYGLILRSKDEESAFDFCAYLPRKMVEQLASICTTKEGYKCLD